MNNNIFSSTELKKQIDLLINRMIASHTSDFDLTVVAREFIREEDNGNPFDWNLKEEDMPMLQHLFDEYYDLTQGQKNALLAIFNMNDEERGALFSKIREEDNKPINTNNIIWFETPNAGDKD